MTQDTIKSRLQAARALIDQPEKWTKGANDRDSKGDPASLCETVSHCAFGALMEACAIGEEGEIAEYLVRSINRHGDCARGGLSNWNDVLGRTHGEVMQAFDRAIEDTGP